MKTSLILIGLALGLSATSLISQQTDNPPPPGGRPGGPGGPGGRPMSPLMAALDTNKDGKLDATEIANASNALKALDKNKDGELTPDEIGGPRPGGPGRRPQGPPQ